MCEAPKLTSQPTNTILAGEDGGGTDAISDSVGTAVRDQWENSPAI